MSNWPTPYRIAFAEGSDHYEELEALLEQIADLEKRIAKPDRTAAPSVPIEEARP